MSAETKAQLAEVKREIKAFEKLLASYGGGYRGPSGDYDHALYERHNRLYERKQGLERAAKSDARMARRAAAARRKAG